MSRIVNNISYFQGIPLCCGEKNIIISWTFSAIVLVLLNRSCNSNQWASCSSDVMKLKVGRAVTAMLYVQCQSIQDGFCSFCSFKSCNGWEPFKCHTNAITWTFAMASSKEVPFGINFSLDCDRRGLESSCRLSCTPIRKVEDFSALMGQLVKVH